MSKKSINSGVYIGLISVALLSPQLAKAAALVTVFGDSYASGFSDWGWSETSALDSAVKKTGTKSVKVSVSASWGAYSPSRSTTYNVSQIGAIKFDIYSPTAADLAKVKKLNLYIENASASAPGVLIANYASPALAAGVWSSVSIPIAAVKGSLTTMSRLDFQDGAGLGAFKFNVDNIVIDGVAAPPVATPSPTPVATASPVPVPSATPVPSSYPVASACSAISGLSCSQITVGNLPRKFFVHLPPAASPEPVARPVVFFFHGDGFPADGATGNVLQNAIYAQTDPDGAVVVQLDGPNNVASLNRGDWAWSLAQNNTTPNDIGFVKAVYDGVVAGAYLPGVSIDPKRIYIAGTSRGGFFVYSLMIDSRTAPLFAAAVSLYGNQYCESGDTVCSGRTGGAQLGFAFQAPMLQMHGDADVDVTPPARIPSPATNSLSWVSPLSNIANAKGCSGTFAYQSELASINGNRAYLYQPSGVCAYDARYVLVQNATHGFDGWQPYAWSFLKSKSKP